MFLLIVITEPKTTEGLAQERIGWSVVVRGNAVDKIEDERSREFLGAGALGDYYPLFELLNLTAGSDF